MKKRFVVKFLALVLPFAVVLGLPTWYIITGGESFRDHDAYVDEVVVHGTPCLFGLLLDESPYRYVKYRIMAANDSPAVLVLGSSRVLQFRREMFAQPFYNAGYMVKSVSEYQSLVSLLPKTKYPKIIIIGLDQWMFNQAWDDLRSVNAPYALPAKPGPELLGSFSGKLKRFSEILVKGKLDLSQRYRGPQKAIGLNAVLYSSGFRNDGSMRYGIQVERLMNEDPAASDFGFVDTYEQIREGDGKFVPCNEINADALTALAGFLQFCKQNGIEVVSFLPPFADSVYNRMRESGKYAGLDSLPVVLAKLFAGYGFEFYDCSHTSIFGSSDSEVLDGFHGSERTYQRILIHALERGSILNSTCDLERLRQDLGKARNRYTVYDN